MPSQVARLIGGPENGKFREVDQDAYRLCVAVPLPFDYTMSLATDARPMFDVFDYDIVAVGLGGDPRYRRLAGFPRGWTAQQRTDAMADLMASFWDGGK